MKWIDQVGMRVSNVDQMAIVEWKQKSEFFFLTFRNTTRRSPSGSSAIPSDGFESRKSSCREFTL
ncbi:hypothetical protein LVJ94_50635 [Pendulispora rubella]|uniref:Uncharacterized protein n=1 Tax=Pendulispora rubella TaxID=2741070 RepID=A0ABZ2L7F1_9BACT